MHEEAIINSIIKEIENQEKVKSIEIEVGELAGIEAEHLKEHLKERVDWKIEVMKKDSLIKCECGYQGKAKIEERLHDFVVFSCPKCGKTPEVLDGKDIKIKSIIYE